MKSKAKAKVRVTWDDRVSICDDDGCPTESAFVRLLVAQALPETERALALMQAERLSVGELCTIIREQLDVLWVLDRGQEGENRRKLQEQLLASGWADIREGLIRNAERAEAQLQRHVRRASS